MLITFLLVRRTHFCIYLETHFMFPHLKLCEKWSRRVFSSLRFEICPPEWHNYGPRSLVDCVESWVEHFRPVKVGGPASISAKFLTLILKVRSRMQPWYEVMAIFFPIQSSWDSKPAEWVWLHVSYGSPIHIYHKHPPRCPQIIKLH